MATGTKMETLDAAEMLLADHKRVKDLFRQYSEAGERAYKSKQRLAEQIFRELEIHTQLEEEVFYPAVRAVADKEGEELIAESHEEHHVVDLLIAELKALSPEDEVYDAKMTVLCENVDHHIQEEEKEMLPDARKRLRNQLDSLGQEMQVLKKQLVGS